MVAVVDAQEESVMIEVTNLLNDAQVAARLAEKVVAIEALAPKVKMGALDEEVVLQEAKFNKAIYKQSAQKI